MELHCLRPEELPKLGWRGEVGDSLGKRVCLEVLAEIDLPVTGEEQRHVMAGVLLVGPRVAFRLFERGPEVFSRLLRLQNGDHLAFMEEDPVRLFAVKMVTPPLPGNREVGDVPPSLTEVLLDEQFSLVLVQVPHWIRRSSSEL